MSSPRRIVISQLIIILLTSPWSLGCQRVKKYSEETWLEVTGGSARANDDILVDVPNDCSGPQRAGRYTANYLDIGAAVEYTFNPGVTFVAGGGYVTTLNVSEPRWTNDTLRGTIRDTRSVMYLQAKFRIDYDYVGLEAGFFGMGDSLHNQEPFIYPAVRWRFGDFDQVYATLGFMRGATYIAGGSLIDLGFGYYFKDVRTRAWLGIGGHPEFTNAQLILEAESQVTNGLIVKGSLNSGSLINDNKHHPSDVPEFGFSVGLKLKLR
jgi:hypothetical protein